MSASRDIVEGSYCRDLLAQPDALDRTLQWLHQSSRWQHTLRLLQSQSWRRVVLTGMGSSFHTLHPLNIALIRAGLTPVMIETAELVHYGMPLCDEQTLIVCVSQSGGSAEILRFLEHRPRATLLAVTNTANSRLAAAADLSLLMQAGEEFSVSCKTYVCGMLILQWLGEMISGAGEDTTLHRLEAVPMLVDRYLGDWQEHANHLAGRLQSIRHLFLLGRGASLAATGTGALIVKEAARLHAEGMSSAAFRHGPMEMLHSQLYVAIFSGDLRTRELNHRLASDLHARGGQCDLIGATAASAALRIAEVDPLLLPMLEILPVEMMTLALASLAGREAGRFEFATKITDTE